MFCVPFRAQSLQDPVSVRGYKLLLVAYHTVYVVRVCCALYYVLGDVFRRNKIVFG